MGANKASSRAVALNGYGLEVERRGGVTRQVLAWPDVVQIARTAEETGYRTLFTPEIAAREAFATLAGFAGVTSTVRLATGVVRADRRDAHTTALGAATVNDLSRGRAVLGLGSSGTIEETRASVLAVRALLRGDEAVVADRDGASTVAGPLDLPQREVPVYLAALGPRMTELAGEVADGVLLNWCTPQRVEAARDQIARGAARSGRDPGDVEVCAYVRACLAHDEPHAVAALKEAAGRYASMPKYRRQFDAMGLGSEAAAAAAARRPSDVPGDLIDAVCVHGTRHLALERLRAYGDAGADVVVVYPVPAQEAVSSILGTVLAAAPEPGVER